MAVMAVTVDLGHIDHVSFGSGSEAPARSPKGVKISAPLRPSGSSEIVRIASHHQYLESTSEELMINLRLLRFYLKLPWLDLDYLDIS